MIIQLSSGQGPAECELAVSLLFDALKKEHPDIKLIADHKAKSKSQTATLPFFFPLTTTYPN